MAHVLIVSDSKSVAGSVLQILLDAGHACGWVRDGEGALDVMRWRRPELLLLDTRLQGLPFTQVLRSLRNGADSRELPVILIIDESAADSETCALRNGAQAQIGKVIHAETLLEMVGKLLQPPVGGLPLDSLAMHLEAAASRWRDSPLKRSTY